MENIWVIPTDKPSRLYKFKDKLIKNDLIGLYDFEEKEYIAQNIYITSDEEIKDCDCYVINVVGEMGRRSVFKPIKVTEEIVRKESLITYPNGGWCKKIILTTDVGLIEDGVQAIDDEFLEWFVENPSCEEVEVESKYLANPNFNSKTDIEDVVGFRNYLITIPKEEVLIQSSIDGEVIWSTVKETLEEATNREVEIQGFGVYKGRWQQQAIKNSFIAGAKWQQERSYSEEEVKQIANFGFNAGRRFELKAVDLDFTFEKWFEQFSKLKNG